MSDFKWGKLHVYARDDYLRVYWFDWVSKIHAVHLKLNSDNSLHMFEYDYLMPSQMWHDIAAQSDRIITYLMLRRN